MKTESVPFSEIPPLPGTYVLLIRLASPTGIEIGKLGACHCPAGWYAYVGSALGPGGLAARLGRHGRRSKRPHWHIDHLLAVSQLAEIWWAASPERRECRWAEALRQSLAATMPLPGFGSSDCRCPGHLLCCAHRPSLEALASQSKEEGVLRLTVLTESDLTIC